MANKKMPWRCPVHVPQATMTSLTQSKSIFAYIYVILITLISKLGKNTCWDGVLSGQKSLIWLMWVSALGHKECLLSPFWIQVASWGFVHNPCFCCLKHYLLALSPFVAPEGCCCVDQELRHAVKNDVFCFWLLTIHSFGAQHCFSFFQHAWWEVLPTCD